MVNSIVEVDLTEEVSPPDEADRDVHEVDAFLRRPENRECSRTAESPKELIDQLTGPAEVEMRYNSGQEETVEAEVGVPQYVEEELGKINQALEEKGGSKVFRFTERGSVTVKNCPGKYVRDAVEEGIEKRNQRLCIGFDLGEGDNKLVYEPRSVGDSVVSPPYETELGDVRHSLDREFNTGEYDRF